VFGQEVKGKKVVKNCLRRTSLSINLPQLQGLISSVGSSTFSLRQALIHYNPRNLQAEPFRQFFDVYGKLLKLKTTPTIEVLFP
jgi:hypothetical protein